MSSPVVSSRTPIGQIINRDGTATFAFLKWMQNIGTTVNASFDSEGAYQGEIGEDATIDGRETLASIVQNISTDGVVQGPGIDFALPYLNKDTDHIADGTGHPLAGGKAAYIALVASSPVAGQTIRFNGTDWLPVAIAVTKAGVIHQWLRSYDANTGTFTSSQPDFADLSGTLNPAQLPADIAYTDVANVFTANQTINANLVVTGTINGVPQARFAFIDPTSSIQTQLNSKQPTITLTTTGTSGAATLVGATLNVPVYAAPAQVYPGVGIGVSTGSAWGTSIDPATIPRLNTINTFTQAQVFSGEGVFTSGANITGNPAIRADSIRLSNGAGSCFLDATGPNTSTQGNIVFRTLSSNASLAANVITMTSGGVAIAGTLSATGAKTFRITHPFDDTKDLVHACLEGPENGVYYRGEIETVDGLAQIILPDYFEALTFQEDRSVQLTQIEDGLANFTLMRASRIHDGKFSIRTSEPSAKIAWLVMAVRKIGVDHLKVEQTKRDDLIPIPIPTPLPEEPQAGPKT